jgi:hypothetical protein
LSILWQVGIGIDVDDEDSLGRLSITECDEGVHRLKTHKCVSDFWQEQPAKGRLHVFVKFPATGEWLVALAYGHM